MSNAVRPIKVLLVEDDETDVLLITKALEKDRVLNQLDRVKDGVEAMQYLRNEGEYSGVSRPDLILLDLNMPRKDGREVLKDCFHDEQLRTIPIVVFTSSDDERDILSSYKYKASSYVSKPVDLMQFRNVFKELQEYWFCIVSLPQRD